MPVTLERIQSPTPDVHLLIGELDAELNADYPPEQRHGYSVERVFQPNVSFFIARLDGDAVGCGGIAFDDGFAEVKRMYVRPQARGKNIAQAILARLEDEARSRGATRLTLETGDIRHAAIRLYERFGFARCTAFGGYLDMPAQAIERSVFMEKRIA